jgi:hypothetical protein
LGDGLLGLRETEGEGGEDFEIPQSDRCTDLLVDDDKGIELQATGPIGLVSQLFVGWQRGSRQRMVSRRSARANQSYEGHDSRPYSLASNTDFDLSELSPGFNESHDRWIHCHVRMPPFFPCGWIQFKACILDFVLSLRSLRKRCREAFHAA